MADTPWKPNVKRRVLLAARPDARVPFRHAINGDAEVIEAETMAEAIAKLNGKVPVDLVCCTLFFDESRMFDLLRWVKSKFPHIPVICARALRKDIPRISLEAVRIATSTLGAATFIDIPSLEDADGSEKTNERLRRLLLSQMGV